MELCRREMYGKPWQRESVFLTRAPVTATYSLFLYLF